MSNNNNSEKKPSILIVCNYYLPGFKTGGGLRTLVNMIESFKEKFEFYVIARDNDGDGIPYKNIKANQWNDVEGAQVFYLQREQIGFSKLRELIVNVKPDAIYLNSVFSTLTVILLILRRLKLIPESRIVLAPEGELSEGALQLKSYKKKPFVKLVRSLGLYRNLIWKTTAELEKQETERFMGSGGRIFIAPNLPSKELLSGYRQELKPKKKSGEAKMIFLSRFMRKKNFKWLADNLRDFKENLTIDIYGPLEDEQYWRETQASIKQLPENIKVEYKGLLEYEKVGAKLLEYHFFLLPTLGENFGHVFIEALAAGCPLVISDRTPWLQLEEKNIGWDLSLEKPELWLNKLRHCINLDDASYTELSANSRRFAEQWLNDPRVSADTLEVLEFSLSNRR
jgi:glycosyltransferase involved in cell wall biosynthesis